MQAEQMTKTWEEIVSRARQDAAFKRRVLADPLGVGMEYGLQPPPGYGIRVDENADGDLHLTLSPSVSDELSEQELLLIAGGVRSDGIKSVSGGSTVSLGSPTITYVDVATTTYAGW
jgi:hypothetical protein